MVRLTLYDGILDLLFLNICIGHIDELFNLSREWL